jgi:hypothetical protein
MDNLGGAAELSNGAAIAVDQSGFFGAFRQTFIFHWVPLGICYSCLNVRWLVLVIRSAVGTIREGHEVPSDRHAICP